MKIFQRLLINIKKKQEKFKKNKKLSKRCISKTFQEGSISIRHIKSQIKATVTWWRWFSIFHLGRISACTTKTWIMFLGLEPKICTKYYKKAKFREEMTCSEGKKKYVDNFVPSTRYNLSNQGANSPTRLNKSKITEFSTICSIFTKTVSTHTRAVNMIKAISY